MEKKSETFLVFIFAAVPIAAAQTAQSTGVTRRASVSSTGEAGDSPSLLHGFSADGRFLVFDSAANNLVPGDDNTLPGPGGAGDPVRDVFVRDLKTGTTERVSVSSSGAQGDRPSTTPAISMDGRFVVFQSSATNLVPGDTNGAVDIFVRDRFLGTTERVSVALGGAQSNSDSYDASISNDGRFVAFDSRATNLVSNDTNQAYDVFVRDRREGRTERVSVTSSGAQAEFASGLGFGSSPASISGDGRFVAFGSDAVNLAPGDTNGQRDIFLRDRQAGRTERINVSSSGAQADGISVDCSISTDGRFVVFDSLASNLVPGDTNDYGDIFVRDLAQGTTERVSVGASGEEGNWYSTSPSISADGRFVVFESVATNFDPADTNGVVDVYLHDRQSGLTERVSLNSSGEQGEGGWAAIASISPDGRFVAFQSTANNFEPVHGFVSFGLFVRDRITLGFYGSPSASQPVHYAVSNVFGEAGNEALVLLSCTGTAGTVIPGGLTLPLTFDRCTRYSLLSPNYHTIVGADGSGSTPTFAFPPLPPGLTIYAAVITVEPGSMSVISVSGVLSFAIPW